MDDDSSERIAAALRTWLTTAPAGAQLPPTRVLVAEHGASPVTVQRALRALVGQGLVETRPGVGTFARGVRTPGPLDHAWQSAALPPTARRVPAEAAAMRTAPRGSTALHAGYPDRELLPERLLRAALARAGRGASAVSRSPVPGDPALRAWFAQELAAVTPVGTTPVTAHDVVVLPGSQSGLSSAFRALVGADRPLLVESPTYWGAVLAAAQVGVRLVPVPTGPDGPDPVVLARAFAETGARALYAQPTWANPTGAQWSAAAARDVLGVVREHGAFLVEDDWAHDFGIDAGPSPVAALDDAGHVVHLRSLTKSVSPALRVAAVIARGAARERLLADSSASSMYVSGLLQAAALDVVTHPGWRTHLRGLRHQLRVRRDLLAAAVAEHAPGARLTALPRGGLNLWFRLPDGTDLPRLVRECEDRGVLVAGGDGWFPAEPPGPFLRLNFAGPGPEAFPGAARILGEALARQG